MTDEQFSPLLDPPGRSSASVPGARDAIWISVRGNDVVFAHPEDVDASAGATHFVGMLGGLEVWAADIATSDDPSAFTNLRSLYGRVSERRWHVAGRAVQLVDWERTHRYCGRCGEHTKPADGERARLCPSCGLKAYPRLAPAVIVRIERGDEILLARNATFPLPMFSLLAGFVEPGETLEECVHREIAEEVGVRVRDLHYESSQPWPFPHSLMLGFSCQWDGGDIEIDGVEIAEANWYTVDDLPMTPPTMSIAGVLIEAWKRERYRNR